MEDETQPELPVDQEDKPSRRIQWITGGAAAAVAIVGVGVAVALSKKNVSVSVVKDVSVPILAPKSARRPLDHRVPVRQHVRQQPFGPNRSQRKEIVIPEHFRGPKAA